MKRFAALYFGTHNAHRSPPRSNLWAPIDPTVVCEQATVICIAHPWRAVVVASTRHHTLYTSENSADSEILAASGPACYGPTTQYVNVFVTLSWASFSTFLGESDVALRATCSIGPTALTMGKLPPPITRPFVLATAAATALRICLELLHGATSRLRSASNWPGVACHSAQHVPAHRAEGTGPLCFCVTNLHIRSRSARGFRSNYL